MNRRDGGRIVVHLTIGIVDHRGMVDELSYI